MPQTAGAPPTASGLPAPAVERQGRALDGVAERRTQMPRPPPKGLPRPRLDALMAALLDDCELLVVSASAGAGKTTAVASVVRGLSASVAWLALDAAERDPGRLLAHLEAALSSVTPTVTGSVRSSRDDGLAVPAAAERLFEAVGDAPGVLVLDQVDRLLPADAAWDVVDLLASHLPRRLRLILVSRRDPPVSRRPCTGDWVGWVGDDELAFDADELRELLAVAGSPLDPAAFATAFGGWVTGALSQAWRPAGELAGHHALDAFLARQVLDELGAADRAFLIGTSLLDEVTVERAAALGITDAAQRLRSLRQVHLPAQWSDGGRVLTPHPALRRLLRAQLDGQDPVDVRALHRLMGRLLAEEGLAEESVEELLRAGAVAEAALPAVRALPKIVDRLDLDAAHRWLIAFRRLERPPIALVEAELTLAAGREDFIDIVAMADAFTQDGQLESLITASGRIAALIAWAFLHAGRLDSVHGLLERAPPGAEIEALRYALGLFEASSRDAGGIPSPTGGPLDALILRNHYVYGRLDPLLRASETRWAEAIVTPFRIAALRILGRVTEANELLDEAQEAGVVSLALRAVIGPEVRLDAGRVYEAWEMAEEGLSAARAHGSELFAVWNRCVAAKIALCGRKDPVKATGLLEDVASSDLMQYRYLDELLRTNRGLARLEQGRVHEALADLEMAVESMVRGGRVVDLPTAAVYLAEARWRCEDPTGSDVAADLALDAAERQGTVHLLLRALGYFSSVLSRRLDAEADADSRWHALGRALHATMTSQPATNMRGRVRLHDLGKPALLVDGRPAQTRVSKTVELLAFLLTADGFGATREQLLNALFDGRADPSSRSYLRTAIHWLKVALPEEVGLETEGEVVRLHDAELIRSDSFDALVLLDEGAAAQGAARMRTTQGALALLARGEFLAGCESAWALERRGQIERRADDARHAAAEITYAQGQLKEALQMTEEILEADPFREAVWRLKMRVLGALGDEDGMLDAFARCQAAMSELGATVAPATSALVDALRR